MVQGSGPTAALSLRPSRPPGHGALRCDQEPVNFTATFPAHCRAGRGGSQLWTGNCTTLSAEAARVPVLPPRAAGSAPPQATASDATMAFFPLRPAPLAYQQRCYRSPRGTWN